MEQEAQQSEAIANTSRGENAQQSSTMTIDPNMFPGESLVKELEGETVVRVSRKVIVKALKAQTCTISALFEDAVKKAKLIEELQKSKYKQVE